MKYERPNQSKYPHSHVYSKTPAFLQDQAECYANARRMKGYESEYQKKYDEGHQDEEKSHAEIASKKLESIREKLLVKPDQYQYQNRPQGKLE